MKELNESIIAEKIAETLKYDLVYNPFHKEWDIVNNLDPCLKNEDAERMIHYELKPYFPDGYSMTKFNHIEKFLKAFLSGCRE